MTEFGEMKENLMLHVLIRAVDSDRMRRWLLETEKLDLAKAVHVCARRWKPLQRRRNVFKIGGADFVKLLATF